MERGTASQLKAKFRANNGAGVCTDCFRAVLAFWIWPRVSLARESNNEQKTSGYETTQLLQPPRTQLVTYYSRNKKKKICNLCLNYFTCLTADSH